MSDEVTDKPIRKRPKQIVRTTKYLSPDGLSRSKKVEHNLNECFAIIFRGQAGKQVRDYLKSITTNQVMPPGSDRNLIQYHEGSRWLMGIIDTRIKDGEDKKP